MSPILWLILAVILAVLFDLLIIRAWQRYRRLRQDNWSYRDKVRAWFGFPTEKTDNLVFKAIRGFCEKLDVILQGKISKALILFVSVGFVVFGQYMMSRSDSIESLSLISERVNARFRIDVNNLDNLMVGIPLILCGGILFAWSSREIVFNGCCSESKRKIEQITLSNDSPWRIGMLVGIIGLIILLIRLFLVQAQVIDTVIWIIGIGGFLFAAFWRDRAAKIPLRINLSATELIQLLLIFILGLIIGVYQLQEIPNSLMGDEGTFLETARSIALGFYHPSPFDLGVYSYPILSSFWQSWILRFFGISLWGWRFASVLPAVLTVFPLYFLSRDLFGRRVAIVSTLVMIFAPYFLAFSRLGYNNSQSILTVALCVWLGYTGIRKGSAFYSYLGGAAAGLGFLTYTAGRLGLVILVLYFLTLFLAKSSRTQKKRYLINAFIPVMIGWLVIAAPNIVYNLQNAPEVSRNKMVEGLFFHVFYGRDFYREDELFSYAPALEIDQHEFFYNPHIYLELIVRGIVRSLLAFNHQDLVSEHYISDSLTGPYATIFYSLGVFLVFGRLRDKRFLLVALWFGSGLFFLSMISTYPPRHQHLVPVIPVMAIIIALGVITFSRRMASVATSRLYARQWLQFALVTVIVLALGYVGLREYFVLMPEMYRPHLEQVMNWFGLHNTSDIDFIFVHTAPIHQEWRPYLFRELLEGHDFSLLSSDKLLESVHLFSVNASGIAVFYEPEQARQITPRLLQLIPGAHPIAFLNRDQQVIGNAVIRGDVTIPPSASITDGLLEVFTSPVMWLLSPLLLFVGYFGVAHREHLALWRPVAKPDRPAEDSALQGESAGEALNRSPETEKKPILTVEKGPGFFEVGLSIRIKLGNSIHSFEPELSVHYSKKEAPPQ